MLEKVVIDTLSIFQWERRFCHSNRRHSEFSLSMIQSSVAQMPLQDETASRRGTFDFEKGNATHRIYRVSDRWLSVFFSAVIQKEIVSAEPPSRVPKDFADVTS
jgi:hypothetical protein